MRVDDYAALGGSRVHMTDTTGWFRMSRLALAYARSRLRRRAA